MQALELILVLLAATAALHLLAVRLVVPPPVLLVIGGAILAAIPELPRPDLSPEVIFLVFVPPLLYWTAVNTSWRDFRTNLRPISLLAVGLVLVTMAAVAVVAHALAPEIGWGAAFVLGAIVSPPDPVAVTAVTRRLGVARDIVTILEGEGLVNDATALVAYRMAVAAVVAGGFSLGEAAVGFAWSAAGGLGVGLAVGAGIAWIRRRIGKAPVVENTISVLTPFAAYIPAERLGTSGVLAVVAVGLYLGRRAPRLISRRDPHPVDRHVGDVLVLSRRPDLHPHRPGAALRPGRAPRVLGRRARRPRRGGLGGRDRGPHDLGLPRQLPDADRPP